MHARCSQSDHSSRRVVALDTDARDRRIADAIAPLPTVFTLIHYIKRLTVYREPALFLVMPRCFMRRPPICGTAAIHSPLVRSLARSLTVSRAVNSRLRNHRFAAVLVAVPHACKKHVSMHRDRASYSSQVLLITREPGKIIV